MEDFPLSHFLKDISAQSDKNINNFQQFKTNLPSLPQDELNESELSTITTEILNYLRDSIGTQRFNAFFNNTLSVNKIFGEEIEFVVPTNFLKKMLTEQYIDLLANAAESVMGKTFSVTVNVIQPGGQAVSQQQSQVTINKSIVESKKTELEEAIRNASPYTINRGKNVRETSFSISDSIPFNEYTPSNDDLMAKVQSKFINHMEENISGQNIDKKKVFENFIVGPSNNLAHASAVAVAKKPALAYPTLYLYGKSGLGKTHLLHAIANYVSEHHPHLNIVITTGNQLVTEIVNAFQEKDIQSFYRKYAETVDILMIDDIHELKNREGSQNQFFHIFNELQRRKKQIIFTSDKEPREISGIEERIRTRLASTLIIEIQQPDLETRIAILKKKALEEDIFLPTDVITLIASCIKSNIRELEGSLIKLGAWSTVYKTDIDIENAKELLKISEKDQEKTINIDTITKTVSNYFKISIADLRSKARNKEITAGRHIAMFFSYYIAKSTLAEIGLYFGKRDHTTVMHAVNKIKQMQKNDADFSKMLYNIETQL